VEALLAQRIHGLCLGYEDLNDHDTLRRDPLLALVSGKSDPSGQDRRHPRDKGKALAGKSTLNRLELTGPDLDPRTGIGRSCWIPTRFRTCLWTCFWKRTRPRPW